MSPEQIEGYMKRLRLKYRLAADHGDDALIHVGFSTRRYRCVLPPRTRHLKMLVMLTNAGGLLTVAAPFVYHMRQAKKPAALHEHLMALNYRTLHAQFQVDRSDGEVRCCAHVPVEGSNLSLGAFRKLLYSIPTVVDVNHRQTAAVLRTGRLPPAPKPPEFYVRLMEELAQRVGSIENLRKIVEDHEANAKKSVRERRQEICNSLESSEPAALEPNQGTGTNTASPGDGTTDRSDPTGTPNAPDGESHSG
jgi:hypothetical protein